MLLAREFDVAGPIVSSSDAPGRSNMDVDENMFVISMFIDRRMLPACVPDSFMLVCWQKYIKLIANLL